MKKTMLFLLGTVLLAGSAYAGGSIFGHHKTKNANPYGVYSIGVHICSDLECPPIRIVTGKCEGAHMSKHWGVCVCDEGYVAKDGLCEQCPEGQYSDGVHECTDCAPGTYKVHPDDTSCTPCPQDSYCKNGQKYNCPAHAACNGGDDFTCNPGYEKSNQQCKPASCTVTGSDLNGGCGGDLPYCSAITGGTCTATKTLWCVRGTHGSFAGCSEDLPYCHFSNSNPDFGQCNNEPAGGSCDSENPDCPTGYYCREIAPQQVDGTCELCPEHATCDGSESGFTCERGYEKSGNECVPAGCTVTDSDLNGGCGGDLPYCSALENGHCTATETRWCVTGSCYSSYGCEGSVPYCHFDDGFLGYCDANPRDANCDPYDGQNCPSGYYCTADATCPGVEGRCQACPEHAICEDGKGMTGCQSGYFWKHNIDSPDECVSECPYESYCRDGKVYDCPANAECHGGEDFICNEGYDPTENSCICSNTNGWYTNYSTGACEYCDGFIGVTGGCQTCDSGVDDYTDTVEECTRVCTNREYSGGHCYHEKCGAGREHGGSGECVAADCTVTDSDLNGGCGGDLPYCSAITGGTCTATETRWCAYGTSGETQGCGGSVPYCHVDTLGGTIGSCTSSPDGAMCDIEGLTDSVCPTGYECVSNDHGQGTCQACPDGNCGGEEEPIEPIGQNCPGHATACDSEGKATECEDGYHIKNGVCLDCLDPYATACEGDMSTACEEGYFVSGGKCDLCPEHSICRDNEGVVDCESGYILDASGTCRSCNEEGHISVSYGDTCEAKCSNRELWDDVCLLKCDGVRKDTYTCCPEHATACDSEGKATTCEEGWYVWNGICLSNCHDASCCPDGTELMSEESGCVKIVSSFPFDGTNEPSQELLDYCHERGLVPSVGAGAWYCATGCLGGGHVSVQDGRCQCDDGYKFDGYDLCVEVPSCSSNSDCASGQYCSYDVSSEEKGEGACKNVENSTKHTYSYSDDYDTTTKDFWVSPDKMNWWDAQNWCSAIGKTLVSTNTVTSLFECGQIDQGRCNGTKLHTNDYWTGGALTDKYWVDAVFDQHYVKQISDDGLDPYYAEEYPYQISGYALCE